MVSYPNYGQTSPMGSQRGAKLAGWIMVAAGFLVVLLATILASPSDTTNGKALFPGDRPVSDADVISLAIGNVPEAKVGQEFAVPLLVFNAGGKDEKSQTVSKIVIGKEFMGDGIAVVGLAPAAKGQQVSNDGLLFVMNDSIAAYDTQEYTLTLRASKAGEYSGKMKVCYINDFCAEATLKTTVR